ncbi:GspE/PulE family protein [Cupriavidus agavae]|uniref:General secretion pathway protein E n=1 Tax=Cupriavidus agavae TaxID=1001822 RepID=A0A4Q7RDK7_9BURK|nr:GspE/PulE family protein [Cupriavidus agavae]RZT31265.1 general secretion pathway protein E [Cupriavidus agavae]
MTLPSSPSSPSAPPLPSLLALHALRAAAPEQDLQTRIAETSHVDAETAARHLAGLFRLPLLDTAALAAAAPRFDLLPYACAIQRHCLLVQTAPDSPLLTLALGDPTRIAERERIARRLAQGGHAYVEAVVPSAALQATLALHGDRQRALAQIATDATPDPETTPGDGGISLASLAQDTSPVVRLVNSTLYDALRMAASDVHMETLPDGLAVRYRVDGVLLHAAAMPGHDVAEQAISRIKVMAELDIAERRIPQDGRFKAIVAGREVDFRVSVMPSIHGEDAVLRVLDKRRGNAEGTPLRLDGLGHDAHAVAAIRALAAMPHGLLLVTGPTGSGKSTTLYAALSELDTGQEKIITIEDPVEYEVPGVLQIPVNDRKGLTFARGLRSILRHDPDKILVGEIRDGETAAIAVQAALTGHLVLTSVHANGAFSVLDRFLHMGITPHSLVESLIGVVAQQLVRTVCPHCARDASADAALLARSGLQASDIAGWTLREGSGCEACHDTGYLGRRPVAEVLRINDRLRDAMLRQAPSGEQRAIAREAGFLSLRQATVALAARGITTLQEANRVTFAE